MLNEIEFMFYNAISNKIKYTLVNEILSIIIA